MLSPSHTILRIQRLEGKPCRCRWGGSFWATSSRSTLFANSAVFVSGTWRDKLHVTFLTTPFLVCVWFFSRLHFFSCFLTLCWNTCCMLLSNWDGSDVHFVIIFIQILAFQWMCWLSGCKSFRVQAEGIFDDTCTSKFFCSSEKRKL